MKIATLAVSPTAFLHLKGPDGQFLYDDTKPVGIDLYGPGSPEAAVIEGSQTARVIKRMSENDNKPALPSIEVQRAEQIGDLVAMTAGLRNLEIDGPDNTALMGKAAITALYSDPALGWIKAQVLKFVGDWGNFLPASTAI